MDYTKLTFTLKKQNDVIRAAVLLTRDYNWELGAIRGRKLTVWRENPSSYSYDNAINTLRELNSKYPVHSVQFDYFKHKEPKEIENAA